jgi:cytochrome c-type biogenesis protein CcmE
MEQDSTSLPSEGESRSSSHRTRFFILGAVVALAVGYMAYAAFPANALYFLTVSEFMASEKYQDGRVLRVSGKLVEDSFLREKGSTVSHFQLTDKASPSEARLDASYVGVMPDLFFNPHSEIILEGRYGPDDVFETDSILVKCPSKYQALEEERRLQQQPTTGG